MKYISFTFTTQYCVKQLLICNNVIKCYSHLLNLHSPLLCHMTWLLNSIQVPWISWMKSWGLEMHQTLIIIITYGRVFFMNYICRFIFASCFQSIDTCTLFPPTFVFPIPSVCTVSSISSCRVTYFVKFCRYIWPHLLWKWAISVFTPYFKFQKSFKKWSQSKRV